RASATEPARGTINPRVVLPMHRNKPGPLIQRAAFAEDAPNRMTAAAQRVRVPVGFVGEIDETTLCLEHDRTRFFGSKTVRVGQRLDHGTRAFRTEPALVSRLHL